MREMELAWALNHGWDSSSVGWVVSPWKNAAI